MSDHLDRKLTNPLAGEGQIEHCVAAAAQIEGDHRERLIQRYRRIRHAHNSSALAKRLIERLSNTNPDVLDGVMRVALDVPLSTNREVEAAMPGDLLQK